MVARRKAAKKPSRLGDVLLAHGLITREQRRAALEAQKKSEKRLGEILVDQGALTRDELNWALGNLLGVPYVELEAPMVDPQLVRSIPLELLRRYQAVPMVQVGGELSLAMADPTDSQAVADLAAVTGSEVKVAMADPQAVEAVLGQFAAEAAEGPGARIELGREGKRAPSRDDILADPSGSLLIRHHLRRACQQGADEILFQPGEDQFRVRYRVHGRLVDDAAYPAGLLPTVATRLKLMANLELEPGILFQEGQAALDVEGKALEMFASVYATVHGPGARIQLRTKRAEPWPLEKLGMEKPAVAALRRAAHEPAGLIAVCGPRRSGCSTTLYALLSEGASPERHAVTLERSTTCRYPQATQLEVPYGPEYRGLLARLADQMPGLLLAEGLHDAAFWEALKPQTLTSTLLLGEMRAEDALAALAQLRENGVGDVVLSASLRLIVAQRLVPRLDPQAREPDSPSAHTLERLEALMPDAASAQFYRAVRAEDGRKIYRGLEPLYEVLEPTREMRDLLLDGASVAALREACERAGMTTLRECAIGKAARGLIELEEAL
ncbi:MAG: GspE/PulE family protein [Candidatus Brocadiia bacterium]